MRNRWSGKDTLRMSDFDKLVYMSRLIGSDPSLVVWGGGNTSIKVTEKDFDGKDIDVLRIKGSGSDMKSVEHRHFPRLRLHDVLPLFHYESMSDDQMVAYLDHCVVDIGSPRPSIETLLHAFLPFKAVVHSHADAIVALTNNQDAETLLTNVFGSDVTVVEYIRPGFKLSKLVGRKAQENPNVKGVVLLKHGLFTWGDTPDAAYRQHIELITRAEKYSRQGTKVPFGNLSQPPLPTTKRHQIAAAVSPTLRGLISQQEKMVLRYDDADDVLDFINSGYGCRLASIGPATPDHLIHTKRKPLWVEAKNTEDVGSVIEAIRQGVALYAEEYTEWYKANTSGIDTMLDPSPRVILVPGVGMWTTGKDARAALITSDIYHHTIEVVRSSQRVGEYTSLTSNDAYDAEYWPLELYKLTLAPPEKELARQVAMITGAAFGIGKAISLRLAREGAHVVVTDIDMDGAKNVADEINNTIGQGRALAIQMDVSNESQVARAFQNLRTGYGGLDILVSNAGIAPVGAIDTLSLQQWQRSLDINTTGHFLVSSEAVRVMKEQTTGGTLVFIGTKNVTAPGADFGAYSASKAAAVQLARVLALENGKFGIRSNIVNPDAVFQGSRLWSNEVREQRATAHGISVEQLEDFYRQRNLLKAPVYSEDVAEAVLFLASSRSSKITGAMIPVDGGVREAFPR